MFRVLLSLLLAFAGAIVFFLGFLGPLTPASGFPALEVIGIYAVLPVFLIGLGVTLSSSKILKVLLTIVMVLTIALIGYTFLSMTR